MFSVWFRSYSTYLIARHILLLPNCSPTPSQQDIGEAEIRQWHKKKGWRTCERTQQGQYWVSMVGGCNANLQQEDNATLAQRKALFGFMTALQEQFLISGENVKRYKDWVVNKARPLWF